MLSTYPFTTPYTGSLWFPFQPSIDTFPTTALGPLNNIIRCDIMETKDDFKFQVDVPGVNKEDINISVEGNNLVVRAERRHTHDIKGWRVHRMETEYGKVERSMPIPLNADCKNISASYENGTLLVSIPKTASETSGSSFKVDIK